MKEYIDTARNALALLMRAGADKAQCTLTVDKVDEVTAEAKKFNLMRTYTRATLYLKIIVGRKPTSITINRLDDASVKKAVENCFAAQEYADEDEYASIAEMTENKRWARGALTGDSGSMIRRLVELARKIEEEYPQIFYECSGRYVHRYSVLLNSNGVEYVDESGSYLIGASYIARDGDETTSFGPGIYHKLLDPDVDYMELPRNREEVQRAIDLLHPSPLGEKFVGTVVASPSLGSMVIRNVIDNALRDIPVTSGTSRLLGKIGQRVADEKLTVAFEPGSDDIVLGEVFTSDGYLARDCEVIRNGVLMEYMLTPRGAAKMSLSRAANSGGAMCIRPGEKSLEEIVKGIDKGLLVGRYSGTQPDVAGDLSGVAKNSFLIENGRITRPLVETMISANIFDMIHSISAISSDAHKNGGSVLPYIVFEGVTIK